MGNEELGFIPSFHAKDQPEKDEWDILRIRITYWNAEGGGREEIHQNSLRSYDVLREVSTLSLEGMLKLDVGDVASSFRSKMWPLSSVYILSTSPNLDPLKQSILYFVFAKIAFFIIYELHKFFQESGRASR